MFGYNISTFYRIKWEIHRLESDESRFYVILWFLEYWLNILVQGNCTDVAMDFIIFLLEWTREKIDNLYWGSFSIGGIAGD